MNAWMTNERAYIFIERKKIENVFTSLKLGKDLFCSCLQLFESHSTNHFSLLIVKSKKSIRWCRKMKQKKWYKSSWKSETQYMPNKYT